MHDDMLFGLIYLGRRNNSGLTSDWKYFRITPIVQMHIEVCEME